MTWLIVVSWDSTEVGSCCLPQVPGCGSVSLGRLFTNNPSRIRLLLIRRESWFFNNREVTLTLIIHCLGLPLFYHGVLKPCYQFEVRGLLNVRTRKHLAGSDA